MPITDLRNRATANPSIESLADIKVQFGSATQTEPTRFADPNDYILVRRPQIFALNNTWVMSDSAVLALRFGMSRFPDNNTLSIDFDPASLGFSPAYVSQIALQKFPGVRVRGYDQFASSTLGAIKPHHCENRSGRPHKIVAFCTTNSIGGWPAPATALTAIEAGGP